MSGKVNKYLQFSKYSGKYTNNPEVHRKAAGTAEKKKYLETLRSFSELLLRFWPLFINLS